MRFYREEAEFDRAPGREAAVYFHSSLQPLHHKLLLDESIMLCCLGDWCCKEVNRSCEMFFTKFKVATRYWNVLIRCCF